MITAPTPTDDTMDDPSASAPDSSPDVATVPMDFCGSYTPAEGDTFSVKVVSVDADNGSMDIVCVPKNTMAPKRGIKAAVAAMNEG